MGPARRCSGAFPHARAEQQIDRAAGERRWTCGRCADAHRRSPWTTLRVAHRPHLRPHAHRLRPRLNNPQSRAQYTVAVYNGSTRFASSISGYSRLIPELEKTVLRPDRTPRKRSWPPPSRALCSAETIVCNCPISRLTSSSYRPIPSQAAWSTIRSTVATRCRPGWPSVTISMCIRTSSLLGTLVRHLAN